MKPVMTVGDLASLARAARLARGWSQQQAADAAGVSRRFVNMLEGGQHGNAEVGRVLSLLDALDVPLAGTLPAPASATSRGFAAAGGSAAAPAISGRETGDPDAIDLEAYLSTFRTTGSLRGRAGDRRGPTQRGLVGPELSVVLDGQPNALLSSLRAGQGNLMYLPGAAAAWRGLSCCLPVEMTKHSGAPVVNWISGLLPDRSEVLARWRSQYELRRQDAYALLWHVGEDLPGAARFVRPDRLAALDDAVEAEPLTDAVIGERIRALAVDAAAWAPSPGAGQFSLAGAQGKFALARTDAGQWAETTGRTPTTHIFKAPIPGLDDQDIAEHITMRLASAVGLPAAHTDIMEFAGARCLVVTRFDRYRRADGTWLRIHQEDAVQALGMAPLLKYEQNGGPGIATIAQLLRENVTAAHAAEDIATFLDAIAFNWLVLGTDAHARNYSLLHTRSSTRLAPLYGLSSFLPYATDRPAVLVMKIGYAERDPARISGRHWDELAQDCGVDPGQALGRVQALAEELLGKVDDVVRDPSIRRWKSPLPERLRRLMVPHIKACQQRL